MSEIELRPIDPAERDELLAMARRYWLELMPHWHGNRDPAFQAIYFADRFRLDSPQMLHRWAVADETPIGFARVDLHEDVEGAWAQVGDFYVEPDHRRQGRGRAFSAAVVDELRRRGCKRIDLNVREDNPRALAFWRSVGFDLASYRMRMYL
jgi:GNAT superfamily N-acetyltransferase